MCKRLRPVLFLASFLCAFANVGAQVTNVSATPDPICAGASLTVSFDAGAADVGVDTLILKNASGALIYLNTVNVAAAGAASVGATVPDSFSGKYTVNVKSVSGVTVESADTLEVNPRPMVSASPSVVCSGTPANITLNPGTDAGTLFVWVPGLSSGVSGLLAQAVPGAGLITNVLTTADRINPGTANYLVTAISAAGCGSIITPVSITVNPDPEVTTTAPASPVCSGTTLNIALTASTLGPNTFKWTSTTTNVTDPADQTTFVSGPINDLLTNTTNNATGSISYVITPRSVLGCEGATKTFNITVNPSPVVTSTLATDSICSEAAFSLALSASTPGGNTFTWVPTQTLVTGAGTQSPVFASGPISDVLTNTTNNTQGSVSYLITPRSPEGCTGASQAISVKVNPKPVLTTSAPAPVCSGTSLSLPLAASTGIGSTFTWMPTPTNVNGATGQTPAFAAGPITGTLVATSNTTAGSVSYLITPQSASGCIGTSQAVVVTVNPAPALNAPVPNSPVCSRSALNVQLSATTPGANTFSWTPVQNGVAGATTQSSFVSGPIADVIRTLDNATAGTVSYFVTPRSSLNCVGAGAVVGPITVNPDPDLTSVAPPGTICSGTAINILLTATTAGASTFTWATTQTGVSGATQSASFVSGPINNTLTTTSNSAAGTVRYIITPRSSLNCVGLPDTFNVAVNPTPAVTSTAPAALCSGGSLNLPLTASTGIGSTFTWVPSAANVTGATTQFPLYGTGPITGVLTTTSNAVGTVSFFVTPKSLEGCVGTGSTLAVTVNPAPVISSVAPPSVTCNGATFNIPVTASTGAGSTFRWTVAVSPAGSVTGAVSSGGSFLAGPISNVLTLANPQTQGNVSYTIRARSAAPALCVSLDSTTYTVTVNPLPRLTRLLDSVCAGTPFNQTFQSTAFPSGTYTWNLISTPPNMSIVGSSSGNTAVIPNTFNYISTQNKADTVRYSVTTTNTGGSSSCFSTDTFRIRVRPLPEIMNPVAVDTICSGELVSIRLKSSVTDSANVIYNWTFEPLSSPNANNVGLDTCLGCGQIEQALNATTTAVGTGTYRVKASYTGCAGLSKDLQVRVNPKPGVASFTGINGLQDSLCSGSILNVTINPTIPGSLFEWTTTTTLGSATGANPQTLGTGNVIVDTLINDNPLNNGPAQVEYTILPKTASPAGCIGEDTSFRIRINPKPKYTPTKDTICSKQTAVINLLAGTSTGVGSQWAYSFIPGTNASGGLGTGGSFQSAPAIAQQLLNSDSVNVAFGVYSIVARSASQCLSDVVRDTVTIRPLPRLTSRKDTTVCSSPAIFFFPLKSSTGENTTYTWQKSGSNVGYTGMSIPTPVGINLKDSLNTGGILVQDFVTYNFILTSPDNCRSDTAFTERPRATVTINPTPSAVSVDPLLGTDTVCVGAEMFNFAATRQRVAPETFTWQVANGGQYSLGGQYALLSFPTPGLQKVEITSRVGTFPCVSPAVPFNVRVEGGTPRKPVVVRFDNNLVCLTDATGGTITNYQWGYDVKSTLDSFVFQNQSAQTFFAPTLDTAANAYWVMATYSDDCTYKSYFNKMPALNVAGAAIAPSPLVKVYPNPAQAILNVELSRHAGTVTLEVTDLTGRQVMQPVQASGNTRLAIDALPSGLYFLNCYRDGQRAATNRFIKN